MTLKVFSPEAIIASDLLVAGSKGVNETHWWDSISISIDLEYCNHAVSIVSLLCAWQARPASIITSLVVMSPKGIISPTAS